MPNRWRHSHLGARTLEWLVARRSSNLMLVVLLLVPIGTLGFTLVEGLGFLDALYQTMITLSTVGYQDLVTSVPGRVFTVLFMAVGVGVFVVTLSTLAAFLVEGRLRDAVGRSRMEREIHDLRGHIILCGYGRFGFTVAEELLRRDVSFAIVEENAASVSAADARGLLALHADATEEATLRRAGIEHARGIISALGTDAANVYVALTAKELRPDVQVVTLARTPGAESKLRAAGADHVLSPYQIGGQNIVRRMLQPHVSDFLDGAKGLDVRMEEITVRAGSRLAHVKLKDTGLRQRYGVTAVAVAKTRTHHVHYNPVPDLELEPGDVLVVVGSAKAITAVDAECATDLTA